MTTSNLIAPSAPAAARGREGLAILGPQNYWAEILFIIFGDVPVENHSAI